MNTPNKNKVFKTHYLLLPLVCLSGCKSLNLVPDDIPESVSLVARCTANKAGNFILTLNGGDGVLSPPSGQVIPAPAKPYRAQTNFTPNQTGRSREGSISCDHSVVKPGNPVTKKFKVRDRVDPVIALFAAPNMARVGETFDVNVNITDNPTGPGAGVASGLDAIHVNVTGALRGPGIIDLAGRIPGPPDGVQGPLRYNTPISITCVREGDATIRLLVLDAARNQTFSAIHNMACIDIDS